MWSWIETHKKKRQFLAWKFINSTITQKPLDVQCWNLNTMWELMNALCKQSLGAPSHLTKMLCTKNGQKVDNFELIYLNKYRYWWNMICDLWAHYQLFFFWLCSFIPTWIPFFFFFSFFFFFFFIILLWLSTFKPLNALYSKIERLKISGRTSVGLKSGLPVWGVPLNRVLQSFEVLNCYN